MKRHRFTKKQIQEFCDMLPFKLYEWQFKAIWHFYSKKLSEWNLIAPRQNGKSQVLLVIILIEMYLNGVKITFTSHDTDNCDDMFQKLKNIIENVDEFNDEVTRMIKPKGLQTIELANGSKIKFKARTKSSGIGGSNDIIIFDELQLITEQQMSSIYPTLSASQDPTTIYAGTHPRAFDDDTYYRKQRNEYFGTDKWTEYGLGSEYTLETLTKSNLFLDKKLLKKSNPSYPLTIKHETAEKEFSKMDTLDYAIQRLGMFYTQSAKVLFSQNAINRCLINKDEAQKYKGKFVLGIKFGYDYTCAVIATRTDNKTYLQVLDKRDNKNGFEWLTRFILDNKNIVGVIADGVFKDSFEQTISKKFNHKGYYNAISGSTFIGACKILENEIKQNMIDLAKQNGTLEELLNVTLIDKKDYTKFAPINNKDVVVVEAMAIANHYAKVRFKNGNSISKK